MKTKTKRIAMKEESSIFYFQAFLNYISHLLDIQTKSVMRHAKFRKSYLVWMFRFETFNIPDQIFGEVTSLKDRTRSQRNVSECVITVVL